MDIFKIYTKWAVENFWDGISMPIGSQEIQNAKVYTVLWDTLYILVLDYSLTLSSAGEGAGSDTPQAKKIIAFKYMKLFYLF